VLAGGLWAWADATGDHLGAARAALAAARAIDRRARPDPATVLSLVAEQLNGAERDQACAVFRARSAGSIAACP
jgi:phytoene/squalene synthetase